MRKVKYFKTEYNRENKAWDSIELGEAFFHQFGVSYEEFETGAGNFSTAIIELPSGEIINIPVTLVKFIEPSKEVV